MMLNIRTKGNSQDIQNSIISQIRDLINLKNLEPGDKLPAERTMSEKFGVSRNVIREAIQKLEFYGLLESIPQSGTFVSDIGTIALNGMIDDILRLSSPNFKSLVETRILLELKTVRLAATRRTEEDLVNLEKAHNAYIEKTLKGEDSVQEDLLFHLAIAEAGKNSTINTLMLMITPKIIKSFETYEVCDDDTSLSVIEEHTAIFEAIKKQDPQLAKQKMKNHFKKLYDYCYERES